MEFSLYVNCAYYCSLASNNGCKTNVSAKQEHYFKNTAFCTHRVTFFMNQKGQESAPFELLVAVIIMGFVMFVGMYAMANLQREQCYNETLKTIQDFSRTLEEVATTPGHIKNYNLAFPAGCGAGPKREVMIGTRLVPTEQLLLRTWSNPEYCANQCGSSGSLCVMLHYSPFERQGITKCINIPPDTWFPPQESVGTPGGCTDKLNHTTAYRLVTVRSDIPEGYYLFQNISSPNSTNPVICAYRRVASNN